MRRYQLGGVVILLLSLGVAFGGGTAPRREDVPKYLKMLKSSPNGKDRARAAEMLGKRGVVNYRDVEPALDPLRNALRKDKDAAVRGAAAMALGSIHPEAKDTVPLLIEAVKEDKDLAVRLSAARALSAYGAEARGALPTLRKLAGELKGKKDKRSARDLQMSIKGIVGKKK